MEIKTKGSKNTRHILNTRTFIADAQHNHRARDGGFQMSLLFYCNKEKN